MFFPQSGEEQRNPIAGPPQAGKGERGDHRTGDWRALAGLQASRGPVSRSPVLGSGIERFELAGFGELKSWGRQQALSVSLRFCAGLPVTGNVDSDRPSLARCRHSNRNGSYFAIQ